MGSRVKVKPDPLLPPELRKCVGYLGRVDHVVRLSAGLRYGIAFGDGQIVYCTEEQLA